MTSDVTRRLMTLVATLFAAAGLGLLFFPAELASEVDASGNEHYGLSMWGACLLGMAAMNWSARASILGGIYGRAVVTGNQVHAAVGFLMLLNFVNGGNPRTSWPLILALFLYGGATVFFTFLMLRHPKTSTMKGIVENED